MIERIDTDDDITRTAIKDLIRGASGESFPATQMALAAFLALQPSRDSCLTTLVWNCATVFASHPEPNLDIKAAICAWLGEKTGDELRAFIQEMVDDV